MILFDDPAPGPLSITLGEETPPPARIRVIGVGGGGGNAVNRMIQAGIRGVDFIAANTDLQVLRVNKAPGKLQLGITTARGMGAGSNPEVGKAAALEDAERITQMLAGSDMVFVTAGMGGGTGTGAAPVVARLASEAGALVVAIVSKPFAFEGRRKLRYAEDGIAELREYVDTLITIPNERLYAFVDRNVTTWEAFRQADDVLRQAVQGISDLIVVPGEVNLDFADVKTVMENMGMALMGTGTAAGEHRAVEAAQRAISNPLLEEQSIQGARAILINITGGEDLTMSEVGEACNVIQQAADEEANIIFGLVRDAELRDQVKISVIATGFDAPAALASRREVSLPVTPQGLRAEKSRGKTAPEPVIPPPEDSGYGINILMQRDPREDVFDIPTFLRRQMD
ncbi:MAG TPA: cell division protein FtsZ [Thermoanaerobaculia bacterium]|jgi:cell division protein FtsZ|nr:cell division protein FtsZ [Thermoanaerobaculia bacterium]HQR67533.1 cell division protein FtsZ [Thermoanaerobaculia bacterium]